MERTASLNNINNSENMEKIMELENKLDDAKRLNARYAAVIIAFSIYIEIYN
jgi:hypothetical protein